MKQTTVGIRELKEKLSSHLKEVKGGATVVVTERGRPIARLVPAAVDLEEKIQQMLDAGLASWSGRRPVSRGLRVPVKGDKMVADLLLEDRE